ncbi:MAG: hypothetical protein ABSC95_21395 [Acetobacteraceae bacterium]|jgi:hypothetical protein
MRQFSFSIGGSANLMPPTEKNLAAPSAPPYQVQNPLRRRLEDAVEDVFHAALVRGDIASAEDLLGVMESIEVRGRLRFQSERKGTSVMIGRARNELASCKARRRSRTG